MTRIDLSDMLVPAIEPALAAVAVVIGAIGIAFMALPHLSSVRPRPLAPTIGVTIVGAVLVLVGFGLWTYR